MLLLIACVKSLESAGGAGYVKLCDMGLAKWLRRGARTRTICGTLTYMGMRMATAAAFSFSFSFAFSFSLVPSCARALSLLVLV